MFSRRGINHEYAEKLIRVDKEAEIIHFKDGFTYWSPEVVTELKPVNNETWRGKGKRGKAFQK